MKRKNLSTVYCICENNVHLFAIPHIREHASPSSFSSPPSLLPMPFLLGTDEAGYGPNSGAAGHLGQRLGSAGRSPRR